MVVISVGAGAVWCGVVWGPLSRPWEAVGLRRGGGGVVWCGDPWVARGELYSPLTPMN